MHWIAQLVSLSVNRTIQLLNNWWGLDGWDDRDNWDERADWGNEDGWDDRDNWNNWNKATM